MMKKALPILMFLISITLSGQEIRKTEITRDNLKELFPNSVNEMYKTNDESVEKMFNNANTIFQFELVYKDKVIYTEGINKEIAQSKYQSTRQYSFRFNFTFCIDYSLLENDDKLEILEKYKNVKTKQVGTKKYFEFTNYNILDKIGFETPEYIVNDIINNNLIIKFYKIEFN